MAMPDTTTPTLKITVLPVMPLIKAPEFLTGCSTFSLRHVASIGKITAKHLCNSEGGTSIRLYFTFKLYNEVRTVVLKDVPFNLKKQAVSEFEKIRTKMVHHWNACWDESAEHLYISRDGDWEAK